jgi:hypothetical protein
VTEARPSVGIGGRRRWVALVLLGAAVAAGLAAHALMPRGAVSDITGDALYAVAAYLGVVVIAPRLPPLAVAGIALAWCMAVELFQLSGLPQRWGEAFPPLRLALGNVFDPRDLLVYALAVIAAFGADLILRSARRRGPGSARLEGGQSTPQSKED